MDYIDLHIHSIYSDGILTPTEIVKMAKKQKLKAIALTDHDTINGIEEFLKAGEKYNIEVIPGIEFSTDNRIHILGYYIDFNNELMLEQIRKYEIINNFRNEEMIKRLQCIGMEINFEDLREFICNDRVQINRGIFKKVLLQKGYVKSLKEASQKYISPDGSCYVKKDSYPPEKCIEIIKQSGGIAVLAHPGRYKKIADIECFILQLKGTGLDGIEAFYTYHTYEQQEKFLKIAKNYDLIVTGGSDFHGNKPDVKLGVGKGNLKISYKNLRELKEKSKDIVGKIE